MITHFSWPSPAPTRKTAIETTVSLAILENNSDFAMITHFSWPSPAPTRNTATETIISMAILENNSVFAMITHFSWPSPAPTRNTATETIISMANLENNSDFAMITHFSWPFQFHWQSQNNDSHSGRGARFVKQKENGKKFVLFVRQDKKDGYGNTCPFICFGLVDYISSEGDFPMNINWCLQQPALPEFIKAV